MSSRPNRVSQAERRTDLRLTRALVAAFLLLLSLGRDARAYELRLWPLLEVTRHADDFRARLLGPLIEWHTDPETRSFGIRPLFWVSRTASGDDSRGLVLYPLASWTSASKELSVRFLGIGSYVWRASPPVDRPYDRELTVFPFVFFRHDAERGSSFSLLPLYANLESFFGYQRVRMLAFPLFLRLEEPLWNRTWLPFPFFSWVSGPSGEGVRVWPIYGRTSLGNAYESSYVGWPIHIRAVEHPGRAGAVTTRITWPLFSAIDGPDLESRSYAFLPLLLIPLYTHTTDRVAGTGTRGFPWPFWTVQDELKTGRRLSLRLTPIYEKRVTATQQSVFYFWPFYRRHDGLGDDASYHRTDVLFVLYRDQSEGEGASRSRVKAFLPFWVSSAKGDTVSAHSLAFLDGIFPRNEALQTLYAPLYRLYGVETGQSGGDHDILWRMWSFGAGKLVPPWYFSRD